MVVNIGRSSNHTFTYPSIPEIPTGFGYSCDRVPEFFESEGVIEAKIKGRWFTQIRKVPDFPLSPTINPAYDFVTLVARTKGYMDSDTEADYYKIHHEYNTDYGPKLGGQYVVLVNVKKLRKFIGWYGGSIPLYFNKNLYYRGRQLIFNGGKQGKFIEILVSNCNSIVPKGVIYKYVCPSGKDYAKNKVYADDSLKSTYKRIEKRFKSDKFFNDSFLLTQKRGFGIFVVQPYNEEIKPQETK